MNRDLFAIAFFWFRQLRVLRRVIPPATPEYAAAAGFPPIAYLARRASGQPPSQPVPEQFTARWRAELRGVDEWTNYAGGNPAMEESVTLAQGLPNTRHVLELTGGPEAGLAGVRVYHPAGGER